MVVLGRRHLVLLFGDSLTERAFECGGWGARLANVFPRNADVVSRGFGAYNTRWCRHVMRPICFQRESFSLITILFGTNDAALPDFEPVQAVPLDEYVENLNVIAKYLIDRSQLVILLSPPSVEEHGRLRTQHEKYGVDAHGSLDRNNLHTVKYASAAKAIAAKHNQVFIDMFRLTSIQLFLGENLYTDGIHFTIEGHIFLLKSMLRELRTEARYLFAGNMRPDWPYGPWMRNSTATWREILREHEVWTSQVCNSKSRTFSSNIILVTAPVLFSAFFLGLSVCKSIKQCLATL